MPSSIRLTCSPATQHANLFTTQSTVVFPACAGPEIASQMGAPAPHLSLVRPSDAVLVVAARCQSGWSVQISRFKEHKSHRRALGETPLDDDCRASTARRLVAVISIAQTHLADNRDRSKILRPWPTAMHMQGHGSNPHQTPSLGFRLIGSRTLRPGETCLLSAPPAAQYPDAWEASEQGSRVETLPVQKWSSLQE